VTFAVSTRDVGTFHALNRGVPPEETAMTATAQSAQPSRIVVVVGVDMSNVSEHLIAQTRDLVRTVDQPEIHVVHVVRREPSLLRLVRPDDEKDAGVVHQVETAQWAVEHLCASLVHNPRTHVIVHTPVGNAADELARVCAEVGADVLVVEAHEPHERGPLGVLHRPLVDDIVGRAPCTVLAIRQRRPSEPPTESSASDDLDPEPITVPHF
jgi:Universal stress protein family